MNYSSFFLLALTRLAVLEISEVAGDGELEAGVGFPSRGIFDNFEHPLTRSPF